MGNSKKKRKTKRNRKIGYNSLGMLAIALVVLVLLGGLMHESRNLRERLAVYDAKAATIEQEIENEQADRKSTRLNSSHSAKSRMPSSA